MGANNADFHGAGEITYQYVPSNGAHHQMRAMARVPMKMDDGTFYPVKTTVGELAWHKKTGVAKITVHPDFQRQGIGSAMWSKATEYANKFRHTAPSASASTTRTDAGDKFLKSVDPNAGERKKHAADDFGDYYK